MLFLVVDAGRPPAGEWAKQQDGPSGVEVALAAADTAVDSATRLGADAFARMVDEWRTSIIRFRCSLSPEQLRQHLPKEQLNEQLKGLPAGAPWRCDDLQFEVGVIGFDNLEGARADRLKNMPTRLVLPKADIDEAIAAGRDATRDSPAMRRYLSGRVR